MEKKVKKKKICFFSPASHPFFFPNSGVAHGGAEYQLFLLAKYLSENSDYEIMFMIGNYKHKETVSYKNIRLFKTIQLKKNEKNIGKITKSIRLFFQLIKLNPDVLLMTNANALVGILAGYAKIFNKKFIYRTSSLIDVNEQYIQENGFSGKLYKYGLQRVDSVITQNKEHQNLLKINHRIEAQIIKNLFEIKEQNIPAKKHILWVSRFHPLKRPELFLETAKHFPDHNFVMICPFTPENKNDWEILQKNAENITNLKLIEKVPFSEIQSYFNEAVLFVNTSDFEGFPNTFLQAGAAKTPLVSLHVNPDNFITEYRCGFFAENDFEKMLSGIKELLNNKNLRNTFGDNIFRYLAQNHDYVKNGKIFKLLIEGLL